MNTLNKHVLALFLAVFFVISPSFVRAQVVSELATQAQVQELQNTLITLLTQLIAQLQAQITELIAQQAVQATQLGAVQTQVNTVVEQTKPVVVVPVAPVGPVISFGNVACDITQERFGNINNTGVDGYADVYNITVPITIDGKTHTLEHSETNLPNHIHQDRTATTTHTFKYSFGGVSGSKEFVVPACN